MLTLLQLNVTTRQAVEGFRRFYRGTRREVRTIVRKKGSGCAAKINDVIKEKIEQHMANDDETTAKQLQELLANEGHTLSKSTILRTRRSLGWTYRGSSYCQLIRKANKSKRLQWAMEYREEAAGDGFKDVLGQMKAQFN